jgi:hypothetical protein
MSHPRPLGRLRNEETDRAIELYPFAAPAPAAVERILHKPGWLPSHDQGREGSCVGHAVALERAIVNTAELPGRQWRRYDPIAIWRAAKAIDEWSFTKPEDDNGTSVRAAYEIARTVGLARVRTMKLGGLNGNPAPVYYRDGSRVDLDAGVSEYRWARTVDEIRAAIQARVPVAIGVSWYSGFDDPELRGRERWLPSLAKAGRVRGGHAVTLAGASDRRQAFYLVNSWGRDYPPVWLPYDVMGALLRRRGEAALVTDRPLLQALASGSPF